MSQLTHTDRDDVIVATMIRQIGGGNIAAISGGRILRSGPTCVDLPVFASGFRVRVTYDEGADLYTVERIFRRSGVDHAHGRVERVFVSELGELAYQASCFHDGPFGDRS